jgi:hypothetical protein
MPESPPVIAAANAGTSETVLLTTGIVPGGQGAVNVNNPNVADTIPQVIIRGAYRFIWGATTGTLTIRVRQNNISGTVVSLSGAQNFVKTGPAAANNDVIPFEVVDVNVPGNTNYVVTGQATTAGVTGGAGIVSTNDCT